MIHFLYQAAAQRISLHIPVDGADEGIVSCDQVIDILRKGIHVSHQTDFRRILRRRTDPVQMNLEQIVYCKVIGGSALWLSVKQKLCIGGLDRNGIESEIRHAAL